MISACRYEAASRGKRSLHVAVGPHPLQSRFGIDKDSGMCCNASMEVPLNPQGVVGGRAPGDVRAILEWHSRHSAPAPLGATWYYCPIHGATTQDPQLRDWYERGEGRTQVPCPYYHEPMPYNVLMAGKHGRIGLAVALYFLIAAMVYFWILQPQRPETGGTVHGQRNTT